MTELMAVDYPFPLRGGAFIARLRLPLDFRADEIEPLRAYLAALAVSPPPTGERPDER